MKRALGTALYVAAWPALMFVLAGDMRWVEGWLFTIWLLSVYLTVTAWMYLKDPALLAERRRTSRASGGGQHSAADRMSVLLLFLGFAAWIALMPLDAKRFRWTPESPPVLKAFGGALLLLSAYLLFRAFYDNSFLSGTMRVQSERGQRVVSTGVYAFVRHPMYLGMVLMFTGTPLLLGSAAGLGIAVAIVVLLATRIEAEERLLIDELDGYAAYRRTVRYRLLPFVW